MAHEWTPWLVLFGSLVALVVFLWAGEKAVRWAAEAEARRKVDYDRRPRPAGSMIALQELIEPRIEHVIAMDRDRPADERDDDQGEGGPRRAPYNLGEGGASIGRRPAD